MLTAAYWQLDADQADAFNSRGNTLVVAGPGSGKTRLLVAKAVRIALEDSPRAVCIVTFSKNAVIEIQHRLVAALGAERAKYITVGTFHALTYKMLRSFWKATNQPAPTLLADFAGKDLMLRCITQLKLDIEIEIDEALQALSAAKSMPITSGEAKLIHANPNTQKLINLYESKRKALRAIDFDDMVREAAFALRSGAMARLPFTHFLADEYQDIDPAQKDWLDFHISAGASLTAVGDDDQTIYGFRASMGFAAMTQFCDQFNAARVNLATNYRCAQDIIGASRLVIEVSRDRFYKDIRGKSTDLGRVSVAAESSPENAAHEVMANFNRAAEDNPDLTFAVISRTNIGLDVFEMTATLGGVPAIRIGSTSLLKKEVIARRVALLTSVVSPFDKSVFVSAIHGLKFTNQAKAAIAEFFASTSDKLTVTESLYEASLYQLLGRDDATLLRTLRDSMLSMCEDYADLNAEPESDSATSLFVGRCFDRCMGLVVEIPILGFLRKVLTQYRRGTVIDRLLSLESKTPADESKREGVLTLLTGHKSKGLEFDHVWIVGCSNGGFPSNDKGDGSRVVVKKLPLSGAESDLAEPDIFAEEERRLFYVAMTRAKKTLTLCYVKDQGPNLYIQQMTGHAAANAQPELQVVAA